MQGTLEASLVKASWSGKPLVGVGGAGGHPAQAPNQLWGSDNSPCVAAIHTDVPFCQVHRRPRLQRPPVLVVEALPLGDAVQLHIYWGLR